MLLAPSGPCQMLEVVAPARADRAKAKQRIAQAAEQVPAADTVEHVIEATQAAVIASTTVVVVSSTCTADGLVSDLPGRGSLG